MPVYIVPGAACSQGSSFGPSSAISAHDVRIAKRRQGNLALEPVALALKRDDLRAGEDAVDRRGVRKGVKSRDDYLHRFSHFLSCLLWLVHFELNTLAPTTMS